MPLSACPYCFDKVDTSYLAFTCPGRPGPAGKCEEDTDKLREERLKNVSNSFPVFDGPVGKPVRVALCPHCRSEARRRACPNCHSILPDSFVDVDSPMLGIVGGKGGGKTVLMTVLTRQLRKEIGLRFSASVLFSTDDPDGFSSQAEYIEQREERLFDKGLLPPPTLGHAATRRRPVVMQWQGEVRGVFGGMKPKSNTLTFLDSAGEDFNELKTVFSLDYLVACDGLMVTLDPFMLKGAQAFLPAMAPKQLTGADPLAAIQRVTEVLRSEHGVRAGKKIKMPFAVVFTKIDAFFPTLPQGSAVMKPSRSTFGYSEPDGLDVHESMKGLLRLWESVEIENYLRLNYDDYRYFGISALGAEPDYAADVVAAGGVRPHRVEDPILWLLSKQGTVPVVRA